MSSAAPARSEGGLAGYFKFAERGTTIGTGYVAKARPESSAFSRFSCAMTSFASLKSTIVLYSRALSILAPLLKRRPNRCKCGGHGGRSHAASCPQISKV